MVIQLFFSEKLANINPNLYFPNIKESIVTWIAVAIK
jgi:hypothetical protein